MAVTKEGFGKTAEGVPVSLYTIKNDRGFVAAVTNFGAALVKLFVPDKAGNAADVVLGYDSVEGYLENRPHFGVTIGPSANRIDNAEFAIDGVKYTLAANAGKNNLHSHYSNGYHKRVWDAEVNGDSITFSLEDADGTNGFPGNKKVKVTYTVTDDNALRIDYGASSDKKTLFNMTNHTYFNLAGHGSGKIEAHKLCIGASYYTPVTEQLIPTGELAAVGGTPFDFRVMKTIGDEIDADDTQLKYGQGYDHNYAVDNFDGTLRKIAEACDTASGRKMDVYTDLPGVQFYAGNCVQPTVGKEGAPYGKRSGFCLETQCFPNAVNQPQFQDVIYGPERPYRTTTVYKFYN